MKRSLLTLAVVLIASLMGWDMTAIGSTGMPNKPQALCVGRFVIDLPAYASAKVEARYKGVEAKPSTQIASFDDLKREEELRAKGFERQQTKRDARLDRIDEAFGKDPEKSRAKTKLLDWNVDEARRQISIGYHPDDVTSEFIAELHRYADHFDYPFQSKGYDADKYPDTQKRLQDIAALFAPLSEGTMPSTPGFCVDRGVFKDQGTPPVAERFTLMVGFSDHPDVRFSIDAHAIEHVNTDEPSLKYRVDNDLSALRANVSGHVNVLERGTLTAAGQEGYQVAVSAPYDLVPNTQIRKFFWSADGVPNDVTRPFMEVDLTIEPTKDGKSTFKDDTEAKAFWDQLMQSIHIRPGAV